jgi:hypothetical protein
MRLKHVLTILGMSALATAPAYASSMGEFAPIATAFVTLVGAIYHLYQTSPSDR